MALTKATLIDAGILLAAQGLGKDVSLISVLRAEELANEALNSLALKIWRSDRRHLLQQEYRLQLADGKRLLAGNDDSTPTPISLNVIIQGSLEDGLVRLEGDQTPFDYQRHYQSLLNDQNNLTHSYALHQGSLHAIEAAGSVGQSNAVLLVTANFIPTAEQVPQECEQEVIRLLADALMAETKRKVVN